MAQPTSVAEKLRITSDSRVLCLPGEPQLGMVGPLPAVTDDPAQANVALAVVDEPEDVEELMVAYGGHLAATRAVWLLYLKGGAAAVDRDSIWAQLVGHGWRLVSAVSVDDRWSALRARPLKPGESVTLP